MAKIMKMTPTRGNDIKSLIDKLSETIKSLSPEESIALEKMDIKNGEDVLFAMTIMGIDPRKLNNFEVEDFKSGKVSLEDITFDKDSPEWMLSKMLRNSLNDKEEFDEDEDFDEKEDFSEDEELDEDEEFDEDEELDKDEDFGDDFNGWHMPKKKYKGTPQKEYHIRVKLVKAPVNIWRELVVPSNIMLEMLAQVILEAMGWEHEHLYQFIGKGNTFYVNSHELKEQQNSFFGLMSRVTNRNSETTSLEEVLWPNSPRLKFEYDYGDSWLHEIWVKSVRGYAPDEEPCIKLLKGKGACPPENCGGVYGYADLLELHKKKHKSAEDKERLEWYDIDKHFDPEECDIDLLQSNLECLYKEMIEDGLYGQKEEKNEYDNDKTLN